MSTTALKSPQIKNALYVHENFSVFWKLTMLINIPVSPSMYGLYGFGDVSGWKMLYMFNSVQGVIAFITVSVRDITLYNLIHITLYNVL